MTFNSENGLEIAPLSADKRSENFFDSLNFSTIVKRFPQTQQLKRFVHFTEEEAILFKQEGSHSYEARIREYENYFFVKVILGKTLVRYCYYTK